MAKKSKKVEKQTRQLIEGISDLVKKKGDKYKFRSGKKKVVRRVKKTCVHWIYRKGKEVPTVTHDSARPGYWKCKVCQASFPIRPSDYEAYRKRAQTFLEDINQLQFLGVKMGGNADDTKLFVQLKQSIPNYIKLSKGLLKQINKRAEWEDRKRNADGMDQFAAYSSTYNYRS